ncbi:MAG: NarK/NasA family nitrate transporter [Ktedonobacterales bacterium]|nr:NarK/NasA family nitrate transporter [Ktedonobacterales bacterium]
MNKVRAYASLTMATIAFAVSFAIWSLLSPLATTFQKQYHINDFSISLLIAIPVLLGSVARIPMGVLTDRFGGRRVMLALLLFTIIPTLGMTTAHSFGAFCVWAFLLGMAGSTFAVGVPFISRWFGPEQQGLVVGIFGMGNIGTAIAARIAPPLAKAHGWQSVFLVFAGVVLVTAFAFYFIAGDEKRVTQTQTLGQRLGILRTSKMAWLLSLFYFLTFGCFVAFGLYLPKLLVDLYGLDKADAGNRAAIFVVVATLARPIGGLLSDKIGAARVLRGTFAVVPVLALVLALQKQVTILTICFLVIALFLGLGNGAVFKMVPQYFAKDAGTVTGMVGAAGGLGGFFPPLVLGFFKSTLHSYAPGYVLLALMAVVCLVLAITALREATPNHPQQTVAKPAMLVS